MNKPLFLAAIAAFVVTPLFADATAARESIIRAADRALQTKPASVMDKSKTPPSGDKHDYMSVGPYWWPDPAKPDGLPYIRRDGETNPDRSTNAYDRTSLGRVIGAVSALGLGFKESGGEKYAEHATQLLRVWFLDAATKMNPNLNYGQAIPGITEGRGIGIIDTSGLVGVVKACQWLEKSKAFTDADRKGMKEWMGAYLHWMQTSKNGNDESAAHNNHGTYYDLQAVTFALYTGQKDLARKIVEEVKEKRIAKQIEPDGKMPLELARTKAFTYSTGNLRGLFDLADLAKDLDVDLWHFETPDGRSLRKALDYLAPYVDASKTWPHQQIDSGVTKGMRIDLAVMLRRAALIYNEPRYEEMIKAVSGPAWESNRVQLLWPAQRP
jgi:Alginate lyase